MNDTSNYGSIKTLTYPKGLADAANSLMIIAYKSDVSDRSIGAKTKEEIRSKDNLVGAVRLPLPNALGEGQIHNWSEWGVAELIAEAGSATTGIIDLIPGAEKKDKLTKGIDVVKKSIDAAMKTAKIAGRAGGVKLDPRTRLEYTGEGAPRSISLSYTFMPKSADEAKTILGIIQFFRVTGTGARTDMSDGSKEDSMLDKAWKTVSNGVSNAFIQEPCRFLLSFPNNKQIDTIMGFNKPFVLESTSSNLFEDGYPALFHDSMPKKITVDFLFKEVEIQYADDWNKSISTDKVGQ
jgi:hypothetical protein